MPGTQTESAKEVVFGDNGELISESEVSASIGSEVEEPEAESPAEEAVEQEQPAAGKYKIGDKSFQTMAEAHAYATSQLNTLESEKQLADAYRQGIQDASTANNPVPSVTAANPPPEEFSEEEFYANPKDFLKKFATKIKTETHQELVAKQNTDKNAAQVWSEFTERHPALADFRSEIEYFVGANLPQVQAVIATKGQTAAYDYIALKIRADFERKAQALSPKKVLKNSSGGPSPGSAGASVTPKIAPKKALSFSEQIRMMKGKRS